MRQMASGARCRWVEGYLVEQSPVESVADFVKQRRRWFAGVLRVVAHAEVQAWIRVPLAIFTALWAVSWLSAAYTFLNLFGGIAPSPVLSLLGDFALAFYGLSMSSAWR